MDYLEQLGDANSYKHFSIHMLGQDEKDDFGGNYSRGCRSIYTKTVRVLPSKSKQTDCGFVNHFSYRVGSELCERVAEIEGANESTKRRWWTVVFEVSQNQRA